MKGRPNSLPSPAQPGSLRRFAGLSRSGLYWATFSVVVLVAFFFRFYRLADYPLGIFFDPAINGLDAIRLIERGGPVIFFPTNGGREALFMYLLVPMIQLFGATPFSIRALTATISLLNVVLLFGFLYDLPLTISPRAPWPGWRFTTADSRSQSSIEEELSIWPYRLWLALLGSLALAVSYWHIAASRLGQRPILVPMLSVPVFWFFLKGWYNGGRRWFILAGLFMGLAGHTYSAARLLPLILGLALLPEFLFLLRQKKQRSQTQSIAINLILFFSTALIIYLPMAWYLFSHPAQFTARAFSVMVWNFLDTPGAIAAEIGRNSLRVLGFFCCAGSPNPIFGLPGYPGLPPVLAPLLLIGLIGAFRHWRHLFHRLVIIWWLIGIVPSMLAIEAPHPWRMIVAVTPTAILVALAPLYLSRSPWLAQGQKILLRAASFGPAILRSRSARPNVSDDPEERRSLSAAFPRPSLFWLTLVLILATMPGTFRAYFIDWTKLKVTRSIYDYTAVAMQTAILEQAANGLPVYVPLSRFNDPTLLFYLSGFYRRQAALAAPPARQGALVISPDQYRQEAAWVRLEDQTATLLPPLTPPGQALIQTSLAGAGAAPIRTADGEIAARLARLPADPAVFVQQMSRPLAVSFGPARLIGATYPAVIDPASSQVPVTLFWQAEATMTEEYEVLVHLVDDNRRAWGSGDARPADWVYPTTFWRPGLDKIAAQHHLKLVDVPPPGRYWLAVSLFDPAADRRLPLLPGSSDSPDTFFIGPLKVPLSPAEIRPAGRVERDVIFGDTIKLAGFAPEQLTVTAGEPVRFTLIWQALARPETDYTVFVHLLDPAGNLVAGSDTQPVDGHYPTSIWSPDELISDPHTLPTTAAQGGQIPAGQYRLAIGLYHQPSGARLPIHLAGGKEDPQGQLILEQAVTVISERQ